MSSIATPAAPDPADGGASGRRGLTRDRILAAAVEAADEGGIERLSMRRLGERLGVEAMSLYNHVRNKEDLLDCMVDRVVAEMALPRPAAAWKAEMRARAWSAYEVLRRHPWAAMLIMSRVNVGPAMLARVDATLGCLFAAGFSFAQADHAWNAMDSHVYGFSLQERAFPFQPEDYARTAAEYLPHLPRETYPHLHALTIEVAEHRHDGLHDFGFGLELILDGLERMLPG
jgi:AcrR family transcriptional regulator